MQFTEAQRKEADRLLRENEGLARWFVSSDYHRPPILDRHKGELLPDAEFLNSARLAIAQASIGHDAKQGTLSTYAAGGARWKIKDAYRESNKGSVDGSIDAENEDGYSLLDTKAAEPVEDVTEVQDRKAIVSELLACLSPIQRTVIRMQYIDGIRPTDIATHLDLSRERVRQIHTAAIKRLRKHTPIHLRNLIG
jgi:RNA polymerase sigma factor (sigma-70 family)